MKPIFTTFALLISILLLVGCNEPAPKTKIKLAGGGEPTLPEFTLPDLDGKPRQHTEWNDRVLVVNFWATWCPPCREEMPRFIELQKELGDKGVTVVAIAIDDPSEVQDFVDVYEMDFPVLIGDIKGIKLSERMGNRFSSLPFTAIYDRKGNSQFSQAGEVTMAQLKDIVKPLL